MATAYIIKHPDYVKEYTVNKNYILFGVILIFYYLEGDRFDVSNKLENQWMEVGGRQY